MGNSRIKLCWLKFLGNSYRCRDRLLAAAAHLIGKCPERFGNVRYMNVFVGGGGSKPNLISHSALQSGEKDGEDFPTFNFTALSVLLQTFFPQARKRASYDP